MKLSETARELRACVLSVVRKGYVKRKMYYTSQYNPSAISIISLATIVVIIQAGKEKGRFIRVVKAEVKVGLQFIPLDCHLSRGFFEGLFITNDFINAQIE